LSYSYWRDVAATIPLPNPNTIGQNGTYFIKGTDRIGCYDVKGVNVLIASSPTLEIKDAASCGQVNITTPAVRSSVAPNAEFTYWKDADATTPLNTPTAITESGTYYIKCTNTSGCFTIKPVQVTISPSPSFIITNPPAVKYPGTVNIITAVSGGTSLSYSYWQDSAATKRVTNPATIEKDGTYYIKAVNSIGCSIIKPVTVTIIPPPEPGIIAPNAFSPNNDGVNDLFKPEVVGVVTTNYVTIFNRYGQQVFATKSLTNYWDGTADGKPLPLGTYYWVFEGHDTYRNKKVTKSGSVTIIK
jgi:gliding motility-associated-like protein